MNEMNGFVLSFPSITGNVFADTQDRVADLNLN